MHFVSLVTDLICFSLIWCSMFLDFSNLISFLDPHLILRTFTSLQLRLNRRGISACLFPYLVWLLLAISCRFPFWGPAVLGPGMGRNVGFYEKCGFQQKGIEMAMYFKVNLKFILMK
ncbi:hypothetical protein C5167_045238 [Papaver somniferum]|uniref:Uncharacterized protein n=1 Tax=Papaver somniferum TaxID=3469 RepID=A0A4Y7LCN6_PAPSO|nr:hypothetical protein C5167_045238 [Papaver somniferum]